MSAAAKPTGGDVSAIMVSYRTGPLLARSLAAIRGQPRVGEIILVDNGNPAGAVAQAIEASHGPSAAPVKVLSGHGNIGFAAGCNRGADAAAGAYLIFINPDAIMPPGGIESLLDHARTLARPWLVAPKLVGPDGAEQQGSRRNVLTPWRAIVEGAALYRFAPGAARLTRFNLHDAPCPDEPAPTPVISGACFLLPREDYLAMGGMDEAYALHVEDVDFCLRFSKAGGAIWFNPHVAVTHYKSSSRADPIGIDAKKTAGLARYFRTHFANSHPAPALWAINAGLWSVFGAKVARRALARTARLLRIGARAGPHAARRARRLGAGRDAD